MVGLTGLGGGFWGWSRNGFGGFLWTVFWVGGAIYLIYYLTQRNKARNGAPMNASTAAGRRGNSGYAAAYPTTPYASPYAATDSASTRTPAVRLVRQRTLHCRSPPSGATPPYGGGSYGGRWHLWRGGSDYGRRLPATAGPGPRHPRSARPAPAPLQWPSPPERHSWWAAGSRPSTPATSSTSATPPTRSSGPAPQPSWAWASSSPACAAGPSGILGFFAVVALIIGGIFNVVGNGDRVRFTQVDWAPASIEQATGRLRRHRRPRDCGPHEPGRRPPRWRSDVVVPLDITASNVTVVIPDNVPVDVKADMTMGNLNEGTDHRSGITTRESSYNTDKPGASLVVEIDGTFSNVTIQEGN